MTHRTLTHGRITDLSLRAKFKSSDEVEVTVVDHATNEVFQIKYQFRADTKSVEVSEEAK